MKFSYPTDLEGVDEVVYWEHARDGGELDKARRPLNALTNLDPSRLSRLKNLMLFLYTKA